MKNVLIPYNKIQRPMIPFSKRQRMAYSIIIPMIAELITHLALSIFPFKKQECLFFLFSRREMQWTGPELTALSNWRTIMKRDVSAATLLVFFSLFALPGTAAAGWQWFVDTNRDGTTNLTHSFGAQYDTYAPADYNGDGATDFAVVRTRTTPWRWYIDTNRNGTSDLSPNLSSSASAGYRLPADYDGDGAADLVTVRSDGSNWRWRIDTNRDGSPDHDLEFGFYDTVGTRSDRLVPADYNGDGATDLAVARKTANGQWEWIVDTNLNGQTNLRRAFGLADIDGDRSDTSDVLEPRDYNGDGAADFAVRRRNGNNWEWFVDTNRDGQTDLQQLYGLISDYAFPADYNGDGRADFAVTRRDGYHWRWLVDTNRDGVTNVDQNYGLVIDHPVPADYNGDGLVDFAVVRPQQSQNVYQLPYINSTEVYVSTDSYGHRPDKENFDIYALPAGLPHGVRAAAGGVIARIQDSNTEECPPGVTEDCNDSNNYVWIQHANGEWSKYSHVMTDSVRLFANLQEGDVVEAGTLIGIESDVGAAWGQHVHFEVGVPYDPADPITSGGFLIGYSLAPRFCGQPGQIIAQGQTYTVTPCP